MTEPGRSDGPAVTVDDVTFRSLYSKTKYVVETADRWSLVITRYRPEKQAFPQPVFGEPILLVHGFSQNRHAWTSGEFVKNLLFFGMDIHVLELRGHGRSSRELQRERAQRFNRQPPADLDYDWDIDSYFLYDLPAAVAGVKRVCRRKRIFFCGHSMGGILGYGYAGIHDDFEGLVTIGSPAELGKGNPLLRLAARLGPMAEGSVDLALATANAGRGARHVGRSLASGALKKLRLTRAGEKLDPGPKPGRLRYQYLPIDTWLELIADALERTEESPLFDALATRVNVLANAKRVSGRELRWLMREGGEREPRKVADQFMRWIRKGELICYRTGYDYRRGFAKIRVPMAIIFGDMDPLASLASTRSVYHAATSDFLLWRPVKGNSHVELTMGHDIRQICYDIKNLVEYAVTHRHRSPTLPRVR